MTHSLHFFGKNLFSSVFKNSIPGISGGSFIQLFSIPVPSAAIANGKNLLNIKYQGDCARLYANGKLIADNFQYGRPFLLGLWRLPKDCTELELRIMPWQANSPIYMPREADKSPGESIKKVEVVGL